jgi:hypothetical protein
MAQVPARGADTSIRTHMIPAISSATTGMRSALVRFNQAADAVVAGTATESMDAAGVAGAFVDLDLSRLAFLASLQTAQTANEMLEEMIREL